MTYKPGSQAPANGIYWCSVCKTPASFTKEQELPECRNKCGRGRWELVKEMAGPSGPAQAAPPDPQD